MHSSTALSTLLILLLSHFSTPLPQPKDPQLSSRAPATDGAKDGCHPTDYINACAVISPQAPYGEEVEAIAKVTDACKASCWPALDGASAASWDPQGCAACLEDDQWSVGLAVVFGAPGPACGQFFTNCGLPGVGSL